MTTAGLIALVLLILAAGCFALAAAGASPARPVLVPLGLLLATLAAIVTAWP